MPLFCAGTSDGEGNMTKQRAPSENESARAQDIRERGYENEKILIGMLQVVSGSSIFGALTQWETLTRHVGSIGTLVFMTIMAASLACAVLAALWKFLFNAWFMRSRVWEIRTDLPLRNSKDKPESELLEIRDRKMAKQRWKATRYRKRLMSAVKYSTALIVVAMIWFVGAFWFGQIETWAD